MKKIISFFSFLLIVLIGSSQENQPNDIFLNKKGQAIFPQAGDWGISVDASPFLNYVGSFLSESGANSPTIGTLNNPFYINGKYFATADKAFSISLGIGFSSSTDKDGNPNDPDKTDKYSESAFQVELMAGMEKMRNFKNRLRGYYGAQIGFIKIPYSDFTTNGKITFKDGFDSNNNFTEKGGNTFGFGLKGYVGFEYFFAPKISVGSEVGIFTSANFTTERVTEYSDGSDDEIVEGGWGAGLSTYTNGLLSLHLYF